MKFFPEEEPVNEVMRFVHNDVPVGTIPTGPPGVGTVGTISTGNTKFVSYIPKRGEIYISWDELPAKFVGGDGILRCPETEEAAREFVDYLMRRYIVHGADYDIEGKGRLR